MDQKCEQVLHGRGNLNVKETCENMNNLITSQGDYSGVPPYIHQIGRNYEVKMSTQSIGAPTLQKERANSKPFH